MTLKSNTGAYPYLRGGNILNNHIDSCFYGIYISSGVYGGTFCTGGDASYVNIIGNRILGNNFGIVMWGGNNIVSNNIFAQNKKAIYLGAGDNDGHGIISANEINHNSCGIVFNSLTNGMTVSNNHILINDTNI